MCGLCCVDDRTKCTQPFEIEENGRKQIIHTKGDRWSYLQRNKFGANAQPFFVLLNNDGKPINTSFAFTENAAEFAAFLQQGLNNFYHK
jgi:thiol:disulfide interchange protein DsbD